MKTLTKENLEYLDQVEAMAKSLGLVTIARQIATDEYPLNEDLYMKFNIPDSKAKFESGNGEGVWGVPYTTEDQEIYDKEGTGDKLRVIILNDALTFPFRYGTIVTVETRGNNRPVLSYDWFDGVIQENSDDGTTLADLLED